MKTITKITRIENEKKNTMKKVAITNMIATTKKKLTVRIENEIEKTKFEQITNVKLLKKIKRITKKCKNKTIKLKQLFNENLMLFLTSSIDKKNLKKQNKLKQ